MSPKLGVIMLLVGALVATFTAAAHLSCIYFGPTCYSAQMAPPIIIESAKAGTLIAPLGTIAVSGIFLIFACYALSGANLIRKLPLLRFGVYAIATACVIRGILPLQLWLRHPEKVTNDVLLVGLVWLAVGLCYGIGFYSIRRKQP